jgi:hypothetical protein
VPSLYCGGKARIVTLGGDSVDSALRARPWR